MENAAAHGRETGRKTWRLRRRTWEDEGGGRKRTEKEEEEDDDDDDDADDDDLDADEDDDDDDDDHHHHHEVDHGDDEDVNKVSAGSLQKRDETRLRPDYFDKTIQEYYTRLYNAYSVEGGQRKQTSVDRANLYR